MTGVHGRTLVTGANGFIGSRMVEYLVDSGVETLGFTRSMGDLTDTGAVKQMLYEFKPERIIHLAAISANTINESWHGVAQEQRMLSNLAHSMADHATLIYAGSMAEHGYSGVFSETSPCAPDTAYGCAKHAGTNLALALRCTRQLDIRVARLFGVFGPGEAPTRLLPMLIARLNRGVAVQLTDGMQQRDFIHVDDVCALLDAYSRLTEKCPSILNFGTGVGVTVRAVCEMVADILGADRDLLEFGSVVRRQLDQNILIANTTELSNFFKVPTQFWSDKKMAAKCVMQMTYSPAH